MNLETEVQKATEGKDEFYIVDDEKILLSHTFGAGCYILACFNPECICYIVNHCDWNVGETIRSIYPNAQEITQKEFEEKFTECYKIVFGDTASAEINDDEVTQKIDDLTDEEVREILESSRKH